MTPLDTSDQPHFKALGQKLLPISPHAKSRRKSSDDFTTIEEELPDIDEERALQPPLLREMHTPRPMFRTAQWPTRRMVLGSRAVLVGAGGGAIAALYHVTCDAVVELAEITAEDRGHQSTSSCDKLYEHRR